MRAIELHHAFLAGEPPRDPDELLRANEDLRDLLEPLLRPSDAAAETDDAEPADDLQIGHYRIVRELGRGGMGVVYEAEQVALGRRVALKLLSSSGFDDRAVARFRREAQLAASLDHAGITKVFDSGQHHGQPWFAMELVRGATLADVVARLQPGPAAAVSATAFGDAVRQQIADDRPRSEHPWRAAGKLGDELVGIAVELAVQVADALACAHAAGVVHRDVKPGNVIVCADGSAKLTDFGIARSDDLVSVTLTGDFAGTPSYASPEQLRGRRGEVDARTDVYSLGAMLYELLTLHRPFVADTISELRARIERTDPRPPSRGNPHVPRDLDAIVLRALEKDPAARYPSAAAFADDLRRWRAGHPVAARPVGTGTRTWRWCARNPIAAGFLAALTGGFVVVLVLFVALTETDALAQRRLDQFRSVKVGRDIQLLVNALANAPAPSPDEVATLQAVERMADDLLAELPRLRRTLDELHSAGTPIDHAAPERMLTPHPAAAEAARVRIDRGQIAGRLSELIAEGRTSDAWRAAVEARLRALDERADHLQRLVDARRRFGFADPATEYVHDSLEDAIAELEWLDAQRLPELRRRTRYARQLAAAGPAAGDAPEWREARAVAARPEPYHGLDLVPQPGLQPLGVDPTSRLLEFAHLRSGRVPQRDAAGHLHFDDESCLVFVLIPGGEAPIGGQRQDQFAALYDPFANDNESPVERVRFDPFLLSKYELGHAQWNRLADGLGVHHQCARFEGREGFGTKPIARVTWNDCDRLCRAHGLVLPTEAQWEYACRAGATAPWWVGEDPNDLPPCENVAGLHGGRVPCDALRPNRFGLHHMLGNVQEWCADPMIDRGWQARAGDGLRSGDADGDQRVVRGGAYLSTADRARCSKRDTGSAADQREDLGLRPAMRLRRTP